MRSILAGLALILLPSLASAECTCTCVRGKATAICRPQSLVEPICQQICVEKVEQSLGPLGGGGGVGRIGGAAIGSGIGGEAGTSVGLGVTVGGIDALSGVNTSYDPSTPSGQLGR